MLVERELRSGLVVAEQSADEALIGRALKQINPRLVLQKELADVDGGWKYKVLLLDADSRQVWEMWWTDDFGNFLPLSSGLIEEVKRWRPEARSRRGLDSDTHNARVEARLDKERANDVEALHGDHEARVERGRVTVGVSTTTRRRYWQRNLHRPRWMR